LSNQKTEANEDGRSPALAVSTGSAFRVPLAWAQWPANIPKPTSDEYAAAENRYQASCNPSSGSDYDHMGLPFVMATYNRLIWWKFFFPKMEEACLREFQQQIAAAVGSWPNK